MERWVVQLSEAQVALLSPEQAALGTHLYSDGQHFLVFRDGFVALKLATQLGVKRSLAHSLPASSSELKPLAQFANGDVLVAAPA